MARPPRQTGSWPPPGELAPQARTFTPPAYISRCGQTISCRNSAADYRYRKGPAHWRQRRHRRAAPSGLRTEVGRNAALVPTVADPPCILDGCSISRCRTAGILFPGCAPDGQDKLIRSRNWFTPPDPPRHRVAPFRRFNPQMKHRTPWKRPTWTRQPRNSASAGCDRRQNCPGERAIPWNARNGRITSADHRLAPELAKGVASRDRSQRLLAAFGSIHQPRSDRC